MNRLKSWFGVALCSALGFGVTACGGNDDSAPAPSKADIEVKGTWTNADFAETDVIDDASWSSQYGDSDASVSKIDQYSNGDRFAVVLTPDDAKYNPATYSKVVWTAVADGSFYYCIASFGCASADQAKNGPAGDACTLSTVDDTDLEGMGCGGFAWTKLTAQ